MSRTTLQRTAIIGHRGAAGLVLENTLASFRHAIDIGVDMIELDVHITRDKQFVVCHDPDLSRVSHSDAVIRDLTYEELRDIKLFNGEPVPLLSDVLALTHKANIPTIVELKIDEELEQFCNLIDSFPGHNLVIASGLHHGLIKIRELRPHYRIFPVEDPWATSIIQRAKDMGATGIDLAYQSLTPYLYWQARWAGIEIMVYTVNNRLLGNLIRRLYPGVHICTNQPDLFIATEHEESLPPRTIGQQFARMFESLYRDEK